MPKTRSSAKLKMLAPAPYAKSVEAKKAELEMEACKNPFF
jgi:hypothetical protein